MGVMSCTRYKCENILCSRYSSEFGYLCNECFQELKEYQSINPSMSIFDIRKWLGTSKDSNYIRPMIDLSKLFEEVR